MLALLGRKGAEEEAIIEGVNGGNTVEARGKSKVKEGRGAIFGVMAALLQTLWGIKPH